MVMCKTCQGALCTHASMRLTTKADTWQVDESALKKVFQRAGRITSTAIMRDETGRSRGFGFVNYGSAADAARALAELDGHTDAGSVWQASICSVCARICRGKALCGHHITCMPCGTNGI